MRTITYYKSNGGHLLQPDISRDRYNQHLTQTIYTTGCLYTAAKQMIYWGTIQFESRDQEGTGESYSKKSEQFVNNGGSKTKV